MKNIFNKTNAPYLAIGTLATLALLASGVFAVAPYVGFLAPVAALSVGLPFIIGGAIISAVVVALSAVAISKNNTISKEIEDRNNTISEKKDDLFAGRHTEISKLGEQLANQAEEIKSKNKTTSEKKETEISSPENEPAKEGNSQSKPLN